MAVDESRMQGPCLKHCSCSRSTMILSKLSLSYLLSSLLYLLLTRRIGTPFRDSLSEEQIRILNESKKTRSGIFYASFIASLLLLFTSKSLYDTR